MVARIEMPSPLTSTGSSVIFGARSPIRLGGQGVVVSPLLSQRVTEPLPTRSVARIGSMSA